MWKGDAVGSPGVHAWIRYHRGTPKECEICHTTDSKRFEWSNKDHKYRRVEEDWQRLCARCHRNYDIALRKSQME